MQGHPNVFTVHRRLPRRLSTLHVVKHCSAAPALCLCRVGGRLQELGFPTLPRLVLAAGEIEGEDVPALCEDWARSLAKQQEAELQKEYEQARQEEEATRAPRFVSPFASAASPLDPGKATLLPVVRGARSMDGLLAWRWRHATFCQKEGHSLLTVGHGGGGIQACLGCLSCLHQHATESWVFAMPTAMRPSKQSVPGSLTACNAVC
jgi:hypothetical protein